jgi:hypothetical protein
MAIARRFRSPSNNLARIMHVEIKTPTVCILDGLQYVSLPLRHVGGAERLNLDSVLICALENDR